MKTLFAVLAILGASGGSALAQEDGRLPEPPPPKRVIAACVVEPSPPMPTRPSPPSADPDLAANNLAAANAFLAGNATKPGVITLPSGIQYRVLASGNPRGLCPQRDDYIKIHYEGSLTDGTVFDSSFARDEPSIFNLGEVIPGYGESVPYMHVGDEWAIYIPPGLGYGARGAGGVIPPNAVLVFRIKLLGVLSTHDAEVQPPRPRKWKWKFWKR